MPAALTRMPRGPSSRTAPPSAASTSLQRLTSAWMNVARPPALVMAATVSLPPSGSRSTTATGAPALASAVAMPRPRPEPPPVTTAQPGTSALTPPTPATWSRMIPLSLRPPDGGGILAPAPTPAARSAARVTQAGPLHRAPHDPELRVHDGPGQPVRALLLAAD